MTATIAKLTLLRALIILVFPALVLLPVVLETVTAKNSLQMTVAACAVTIVLGMIAGSGLLLLKSLSGNLWFRLLFLLGISSQVCIYLDILLFPYRANFDFFGFDDGARPLGGIMMLGAVGLVVVVALISVMWRYEDQVIDAFAILFAVSAFSTILFAGDATRYERPGAAERSTPANDLQDLSIYIVFDGMIGSAGLRMDIPENTELAEEIDALYRQYGFLHYPRAFSRHVYTIESIPAALNGLSTGVPDWSEFVTTKNNRTRVIENRLFDSLRARKLPVHVYQTQFLNVCSHEAVVSCNTIATADRLSPHIPPDFQVSSKFVVGLHTLEAALKKSFVTEAIFKAPFQKFYAVFLKYVPRQHRLLFGFTQNTDLTFDSQFEQLATDITSGKGGAYYGHFIMPHYPFRLSAQCRPIMERFTTDGGNRFDRLVEVQGFLPDQAEQKRKEIYASYRDQVRCVHRKLSALFDELKRQGRFDGATITLMGDHGSRISNAYSQDGASNRDHVDNYSTLFAVKQANSIAQSDPRIISVQQLLMAHQSKEEVEVTGEIEQTIVIRRFGSETEIISDMPTF